MKKINFLKMACWIILIAGLCLSCKKGDAGPIGPQGEQGPKGDKGDRGAQGATGNANVKSKTFNANQIAWTLKTLYGTNYRTATLSLPELTKAIVDNGAVMVYSGLQWESPWSALPLSFYESGQTYYFTYGITTGNVTLRVHNSNNTTPSSPSVPFRIVIMTGSALSAAKQNKIDLGSFGQVKEQFKLGEN